MQARMCRLETPYVTVEIINSPAHLFADNAATNHQFVQVAATRSTIWIAMM
jgi:hypothetical protein